MPTLLPVHFDSTLPYHHPASPNNPLHAKLPPMEARILNQSEEHLWSDFVEKHPLGNLHQTPEWGHFQEKVPGRGKYWIIVITAGGQAKHNFQSEQVSGSSLDSSPQILAGTLLLRQSLPHGYSWLYAPRGPLLNYENPASAHEQMVALMPEIKKIAKQEKTIFLRVDPMICFQSSQIYHDNCPTNLESKMSKEISARADFLAEKTALESHLTAGFPPRGCLAFPHFRQNIHGFQPDHTLLLDLTHSEQEILAQMKPKGRYNIKLAEKHGVTIRRVDSAAPDFHSALASFYEILSETTSRDGFHGHDQKFYENMLTSLGAHSTLYLAEYEGRTIAAALNTFHKNTATYYYGASSNEHRNVMAPYLLHWKAILDAKAAGYKSYDFFGIAPENTPNHPWAGVTEFKKKFGGTEVSYQLPQEFIFKKALYSLYRAYKKLR